MTGTPSRTARVSGARRNLKEAAGKLLARGTRIAYEALAWMGERAIRLKAQCHPDRTGVYAAGMWEESHASYPERSEAMPTG